MKPEAEQLFSAPESLYDCELHGHDTAAELIVAEGDSAAAALASHRDPRWQAVLAMRGKPMNALTSSKRRIAAHEPFVDLCDSLGAGWADTVDIEARRYARLVLCFDADVDGVHSRSLTLLFLYRYLGPLLEAGAVFAARPPLWEIRSEALGTPLYAFSDEQFRRLELHLNETGVVERSAQRYRGVASMPSDTTRNTCLDPETRVLTRLSPRDAEAVIKAYDRARSILKSR